MKKMTLLSRHAVLSKMMMVCLTTSMNFPKPNIRGSVSHSSFQKKSRSNDESNSISGEWRSFRRRWLPNKRNSMSCCNLSLWWRLRKMTTSSTFNGKNRWLRFPIHRNPESALWPNLRTPTFQWKKRNLWIKVSTIRIWSHILLLSILVWSR